MVRSVIDLQAHSKDFPNSDSGASEAPHHNHSEIGLLVLTNDPMLFRVLEDELHRLKFDTQWASTYEEAVNLSRDEWDPAVVVVDLLIPRAERYSICSIVRSALGVPVVAVGEQPDVPRAAKLGADGFLSKPFSPQTLAETVRAVLDRAATHANPVVARDLKLETEAKIAYAGKQRINLSHEEFELLLRLATAPQSSVSKMDLLKSIRGAVTELDKWLIEIHIMRLMIKLAGQSICRIDRTPADDGFILMTEPSVIGSKVAKKVGCRPN